MAVSSLIESHVHPTFIEEEKYHYSRVTSLSNFRMIRLPVYAGGDSIRMADRVNGPACSFQYKEKLLAGGKVDLSCVRI